MFGNIITLAYKGSIHVKFTEILSHKNEIKGHQTLQDNKIKHDEILQDSELVVKTWHLREPEGHFLWEIMQYMDF